MVNLFKEKQPKRLNDKNNQNAGHGEACIALQNRQKDKAKTAKWGWDCLD